MKMKVWLPIFGVFLLALGGFIGHSFTDDEVGTVRGAEKVWTKAAPVETEPFSSGSIGNQYEVIETVEENVDSGYKKTSDSRVFWENSKGYVEVDPHTCTSFHCVHNVNIRNKDAVDHSLNFAFEFPDNAKNPKFYRLETVQRTRPTYTTVEHSDYNGNGTWNNYTTTEQSGTETYEVQEYVDRSGAFDTAQVDGKTVYYTTSVNFISGSSQTGRFEYDLVPQRTENGYESSGKWEMTIWKGEYSDPTWSLTLDPWFNTSFSNRFPVTVNSSQVGENVTDFPTFFNLSDSPSGFWSAVQSDGGDILVTQGPDDSEVQVSREVVEIDTTSEVGELWFKGNLSNLEDTVFYVYYGNPSADLQNDPATWRDEYVIVQHFNQDPSANSCGGTEDYCDSTQYANNGTIVGTVTRDTGKIGNATRLDGTNDFVNASNSSTLNVAQITASLWVNMDAHVDNAGFFSKGTSNANYRAWDRAGASAGLMTWAADGTGLDSDNGYIQTGDWFLITLRYDGSTLDILRNATEDYTTANAGGNLPGNTNDLLIGALEGIASQDSRIDEFRIYNGSLTDGWITTEYNNQFSPSTFYTVGGEESNFGWQIALDAPTNGFTNTTVDGNTTFFATPLNTQNATASIVNSTLYSNVSGTWEARASNSSALANNTQFSIVDIEYPDGNYIWNMELCGDDGGVQCVFDTANFTYIVRTTPQFSNNQTTPVSGVTWGPDVENVTFNVTWFDDADNFDTALIEHNLTGTLTNFTMTNLTGAGETANYSYNFATRPAAGTYIYRFIGNDTAGNVNSTQNLTYIVAQRDADITITSSAGISFTTGTSTTITATADSEASGLTLELDSVVVANPITTTLEEGTHNATAYTDDSVNFSNSVETVLITVNPLSLCTSDETFAFEQNFTPTGANMTFNFTDEVDISTVKPDLSDVFVVQAENDTTLVTVNQTDGNYLNVNTTGFSDLTIRWANYFANRTYENSSINSSVINNMTSPTQINQYVTVNLLDEITFEPSYPPGSETTLFIECDLGESVIEIENTTTKFIVATENVTERALVRVSYDAENFYSRQLLPEAADAITLNFYLVDAFEFAVDRIDFIMADPEFYDGKIVVYRTVSGQDIVMTEGNFDVSRLFAAYLREDALYSIRVVTDSTTREFGEILVTEPATKTLGEITVPLVPETKVISGEVLMQAFADTNRTQITAQYVDSLENTTNVTISVFFENGTLFNQTTFAADTVTATYNITSFSEENFYVTFEVIHGTFGTFSHLVSLFASVTNFLPAVGSGILIFLSLSAVLLVGGNATKETIGGSSIAMSVILIAAMAINWMPRNSALVVFSIMMLIFGIIVSTKRSGEE